MADFQNKVFRTFDFENIEACLNFVEMLCSFTPESREQYIKDNKISESTLLVLDVIVRNETERYKRLKEQLEIEKDAQVRASLEHELQRMRLAKELTQSDRMCPIGSDWSFSQTVSESEPTGWSVIGQ